MRRCAAACALLLAAAGAGGAATPQLFLLEAALNAQLPVQELVQRAHRGTAQASLSEHVLCTSLSGPGCLAGVAAAPSVWAWRRNDTGKQRLPDHQTPWLQPTVTAGHTFSWSFVASAAAFDARLALGDTLVLFFSAESNVEECRRAAEAVRVASLMLRAAPLRYLAVSCDVGSPASAVCTHNVVGSVPQLRLFYGPGLSVRMDPLATLRALEAEDDDDEEEEEDDEVAPQVWSPRTVVAFYRASTTPATRAKLETAQKLMSSYFSNGASQPALSRRLATELGGSDEEEEEEDAVAAAVRSRSKLVLQALGNLIVGRREAGDEVAATSFRAQVEALLHAQDLGVTTVGEGADSASPAQTRSLPSRVRRHLQLVNARALPIEVIWIDFTGDERPFSRCVCCGRAGTI
jgi:hypothetical protein